MPEQREELLTVFICKTCKRSYRDLADAEACELECSLKACPYCGGVPEVSCYKDELRITCKSCGASTRHCDTTTEAAASWNGRFNVL